MTIIAVTGTPGTGKTTFSQKLAKDKGYTYLDVNRFIDRHKLTDDYDKKKNCKIIDEEKLVAALIKRIKEADKQNESLVIDSHLSHEVPREYIDKVYVMRAPIERLHERLTKRGYSQKKVKDNIDAEIFETILQEVEKEGHEFEIIET